ncbi:MAG: TonB-dependent receptor [Deltaproteobacteria bacterium]|jgi:vitamin B12 transporter|nr:TonB-dependent receptor [Deltaproteobacteria bacterium]
MYRVVLRFLGGGALLALALAAPLWAQESTPSRLDTMVVTASRVEESLREVSSNITVITREEIDSRSASVLEDLLPSFGINVKKNPGTLSTVQIRGFATDAHGNDLGSHVLVLLNGRRLGTGNAAMISLVNAERIEIIRGPAAVQYGAASMGGVINVITKRAVNEPFHARVSAKAGSFAFREYEANFSGSAANFDFAAGVNYESQNSFKTGLKRVYLNSDYENYAAAFDVGRNFWETHRVGLTFNYYNAPDSGSPGTFNVNPSAANRVNRTKKSNVSLGLDYDGGTQDGRWDWLLRYSVAKDKRLYDNPLTPLTTSVYKVDARTGQAQLSFKGGLYDLTGGVDYLHYDLYSNAVAQAGHGSIYKDMALFAIGKLRLWDGRVILTAGGRQDFFSYDSKEQDAISQKINHFSPSLGVAYLPFDFLKIRAHYAQAFAMPTDSQISGDFWVSATSHYVPSPNLEPETSDVYEIGVDYLGKYTDMGLTYFFITSKKYISYQPAGTVAGVNLTRAMNLDRAYRGGVEFSLSSDIARMFGQDFTFKPSVSLTHFFKSRQRNTPTSAYTPVTGIPETTITYGIYFNAPKIGLMANLSIGHYGRERQATATGTTNHDPYNVTDLVVEKRIFDFAAKGQLKARLEINNFTNEEYATQSSNYQMPGRTVHMGLVYDY